MKVIIFDFEVFKYDCLLGAKILEGDSLKIYQTWDLKEIKKFYYLNEDEIWVGHNNLEYDSLILETILKDKNPYKRSKEIIEGNGYRGKPSLPKYQYDIIREHFGSLKAIEAAFGKNISESEVDFDIDRPLTEEEKRLTEKYNRDDLDQTYEDFLAVKDEFTLRIELIKEFKLPLNCLSITGTQLAEKVLHAESIPDIDKMVINPIIYPQLKVKNQEVIDFYLQERFKTNEKLKINLCGVEHKLGAGGIHAAKKGYHTDWAYYFDVSGYYNLVMMNYDLLPRSIPKEYQELYKFMYHQQLELKKQKLFQKRQVYKVILLAVFGAMNYKGSKFYDPYKGSLVTIVGQLFLVDLLEKLEGKIDLIQSNTDGVIAKPLPGVKDEELLSIIDEWQERTGFTLKLDKIYNIHQRDVNNYMYQEESGEIHTLGEAVKYYNKWDNVLLENSFNSKEPIILQNCIVEYYINKKLPEEVIKESKNQLRLFQYIIKKLSYDWLEYETKSYYDEESSAVKIQNVNRAFAFNSEELEGKIYKYKFEEGKIKKSKVSSLPDNVFVYNDEILSEESKEKIIPKINYDYYVERAYERITEFLNLPKVKGLNI